MAIPSPYLHLRLRLLLLLLLVWYVAASHSSTLSNSSVNPFTAKAALIRYWNRKVPNNYPHPSFFVSKVSPLSALDSATFSSLAAAGDLSARLPALCSAGRLLCGNYSAPVDASLSKSTTPSAFSSYENSNFSSYGTGAGGGADSFASYSPDLNVPIDTFRRYSRDAAGHNDSFTSYAPDGNVVTANFTSYGSSATGGAGSFTSYDDSANVPDLRFTNYEANSNGRSQSFSSYSNEANSGSQSFAGYGKSGNGVPVSFTSYGNESNVIGSGFANYGENGNGATDSFTAYGSNGNVPENTFRSYGSGGNAGSDRFKSYRDQANVGDDSFTSYAKNANGGDAGFENYGKSFNEGSDTFKGYGEGTNPNHQISFKGYFGDNTTFKGYAKSGVSFKDYHNSTSSASLSVAGEKKAAPAANNRWAVEPGKFFREKDLAKGTVMPMPDIRDRMPARSFLPRSIAGRIPFSASEVQRVFGILPDTAMGKAVADTVAECNRPPSRGETKRCAASAEDVIDFAVEVLGNDVVVRSTESSGGSKGPILIGNVKGINGGKVTKSVSCHQSLFPYLVYYCHSVPKVRVYEADILDVKTKARINHGVAICHLDTSDWSANHGAFVALGGKPGEIEVCHWIFQGDMTWAVAD
ncbi:BURP domain-containing protein 12-like [Typha latifolia]|uniref:BURP domain-containing protein 12-like n=1 Tax=Typha latifolia TaxID=4733 RepID=UPI003C2E8D66